MSKRDELEKKGQAVRKEGLIKGIIITATATVAVLLITMLIAPYPIFYLSAAALTAVAAGYYGLTKIEPGEIGQKNVWGNIKPKYVSHGVNWSERIVGINLDRVDVREQITEIPFITVTDRNGVKTKFKNIQVRWQKEDPLAFCLHATEKMVDVVIKSSASEALREFAKSKTYGLCRQLISEAENKIKENIEKKLREEEYLGINIISIDIEDVEGSEVVEKEDQEIKARDKRMNQLLKLDKKLEKRYPELKGAARAKELKVLTGIAKEEITTQDKKEDSKQEKRFEIGPNTTESLAKILDLIPRKENKND